MKSTVLAITLILAASLRAQELTWASSYYYHAQITQATKVAASGDKVAIAGYHHDLDSKNQGCWLAVINSDGEVKWSDTVKQNAVTFPQVEPGCMKWNKNGELYLAVNYFNTISLGGTIYSTQSSGCLLAKYNSTGTRLWVKNVPDAAINDLEVDKNDKMCVLLTIKKTVSVYGHTVNPDGTPDVLMVRLDANDQPEFAQHVKGNTQGLSLDCAANGDVLIYGQFHDSLYYNNQGFDWSHKEGDDGYILRTDSTGALVSFNAVFQSMFMHPRDMAVLESGDAVICGKLSYKSTWSYLQTYPRTGSMSAESQFSGYGYASSHEIRKVCAYKNTFWALHNEFNTVDYGIEGDEFRCWELVKYDADLNVLLRDTIVLPLSNNGTADITVDADGNLYLVGCLGVKTSVKIGNQMVHNSDEYDQHETFFVAKFSNKANTLSVSEKQKSRLRIYPNPTSGTLFVDGIHADKAQVRIVDLIGKTVYSGTAGKEGISLVNMEKGVYIAEINTPQGVVLEKIILK